MQFYSQALKSLWEEVANLSDEERPFCRKEYALPMPCCDLTPYVADMLSNNEAVALEELWEKLFSSRHLLSTVFNATLPDGFNISIYAQYEILAAYALMLRCGETWPGICVVATTLSTHDFTVSQPLQRILMNLATNEIKHAREWNSDLTVVDELDAIQRAISMGITTCNHFAELMKRIPPMVRISIANMLNASDDDRYHKRLHFDNGYAQRCYGCSEALGWAYAEALDILEPMDGKDGDVLEKMTKEELLSALRQKNMTVPASTKKGILVEMARAFPTIAEVGMIFHKADLIYRLKPEHEIEGKKWAEHYGDLHYLAAALLSTLGIIGIEQSRK